MKKKRVRTIFLWIGGSIVALTLVLQALFFFLGDEILKESILVAFRQYANQRFQPSHQPSLDFDELQLNLLGGNITVTDLQYENGIPLQDSLEQAHTLYRISIPEASIDGVKLLDIYLNRKIQLDQIYLKSPRVAVVQEQSSDSTRRRPAKATPRSVIAEQERKIYQTLTEYFKMLSFNKLEILNASVLLNFGENTPLFQDSLTYRKSEWFAHQFTIILEDFQLDSVSRQQEERLLFTKNIQIKLGAYQLILPDSSYAIQADTLVFSTQQQKLAFKGFEIIPLQAKDSSSWYNLQIPELEMTEIDLLNLYHNRIVNIDSLNIKSPDLRGYRRSQPMANAGKTSAPQLSAVHPDSLYSEIQKYCKRLGVNQFNISTGQLHFFRVQEDTLPWLEVPDYSLSFNDFQLDSAVNQRAVDTLSNVLPMDSIDIEMKEITLWFPDRQHYFAANDFQIKTDRLHQYACDILFDSARVLPRVDSLALFLTDTLQPRLGYDIRTSKVEMHGIDLEELSFSKFATMDSVRIRNPTISIANFTETPYGSLPLRSQGRADDTTNNTIKEIFFNWSHARLNLYPVVAPDRPDSWFEQLLVNALYLDNSRVKILKAKNDFSGFTEIAHVANLQAYYQDLSIGNEAHPLIDLTDTVAMASRVAVYAEEVDMQLNNSWFQFPYNQTSAVSGGWLEAEEVKLSTLTSRGYVSQVKFWPNRSATRLSANQMEQLNIPYFGIEGIDFGQLYNLQEADINRIALISPTINLRMSPGTRQRKGDFSMQELYFQVEPYLNRLSVEQLEVQNAAVTLQPKRTPTPDVWFSTSAFNVTIDNFFLDSVTSITPERPFYSESVRVGMDQFTFSLPMEEGEEVFQAERFLYSSYTDQLTVDNLQRIRDSLAVVDDLEELEVAQLALHQMNYFRYFTDQEIEVEKVIIRRPLVHVNQQNRTPDKAKNSGKAGKTLQPELYPKIKSVAQGIYVNQLAVEEGVVTLLSQDTDTVHYFTIDTLTVNANRLAIDAESHQREAKMFFADEIDFNIHFNQFLLRLPEAQQSIRAREVTLTNQSDRISINALEIEPYGFQHTRLADFPEKNLISLRTPSLQVVGLDVEKAYLKGEIDMQEVNLMNPQIDVFNFASASASDTSSGTPTSAWSEISPPYLKELAINQINLTNGTVKVYQHQDDDTPAFGAERLDLSVLGLLVDSTSYTRFVSETPESSRAVSGNITRRLLLADDLLVRIRDYQIAVGDTLYTAKADMISLSTKNPQLEISEFVLEPRVPRYLYKDYFSTQKTRVAAQIQTIRLIDIDFEELIRSHHFKAHSLTIDDIQIDAFKDARAPRNEDRVLPMHQDMLLNMNLLISLDTIRVSNGFINYAERAPEAGSDGIITFDKFNALLLNVTNHPDRVRDSVVFSMAVNTEIMGKGDLKATFRFPMADQQKSFTASGSLGPIDLQAFNPILEPAAFVHIKKGYANGMRFLIQGNQHRAIGAMRFNYEDLAIQLVDKSKGRPGLDERVGSFIANTFVVKSDNPRSLFLRVGEINYERDPSRSMFSYWWRSLLSGIKSSIGMQPVAERTRDITVIEEE
uniref:DUF748 domain-containing protein n=1 Tax=Roseihalotalea indica TaxID=2867963 RepID=A0AA49JG88_9BACT|nr:hypothetical protein K4G66_30810 [Tunicatimonas sp. TK19036]